MKLKFILLLSAFLLWPCVDFAQVKATPAETQTRFPAPKGYVSDYEGIFTNDQKVALGLLLKAFEDKTTNQIAIVTVSSIAPYTDFAEYAFELSKEWKVGQKGKDNGLTIVFSTALREIRISTGYGTEKILTNAVCRQIIDTIILPEFKKGNYYIGIGNGVEAIMAKWQQEKNNGSTLKTD